MSPLRIRHCWETGWRYTVRILLCVCVLGLVPAGRGQTPSTGGGLVIGRRIPQVDCTRKPCMLVPGSYGLVPEGYDGRVHFCDQTPGNQYTQADVSRQIKLLGHGIGLVRACAAEVLGRIGDPRAVSAVEPLTDALKDTDSKVRRRVAEALGKFKDPRAVEPLIAALKDSDAKVRVWAAWALGKLQDQRAVEPLIVALKDADWGVRMYAADALGKIKDSRAVEPLIAALQDTYAGVRESAAVALGETKDPRAVEPLIAALKDTDANVRWIPAEASTKRKGPRTVESQIAAQAAVNYDQAAHEWTRTFESEGYAQARQGAAGGLGETNDPRAVDPLIAALKDTDYEVRRAAVASLGKINDPRAVSALLARKRQLIEIAGAYTLFIERGEPGSEEASIDALFQFGNKGMAEALLNCGNLKLGDAARLWAWMSLYQIVRKKSGGREVKWGIRL